MYWEVLVNSIEIFSFWQEFGTLRRLKSVWLRQFCYLQFSNNFHIISGFLNQGWYITEYWETFVWHGMVKYKLRRSFIHFSHVFKVSYANLFEFRRTSPLLFLSGVSNINDWSLPIWITAIVQRAFQPCCQKSESLPSFFFYLLLTTFLAWLSPKLNASDCQE